MVGSRDMPILYNASALLRALKRQSKTHSYLHLATFNARACPGHFLVRTWENKQLVLDNQSAPPWLPRQFPRDSCQNEVFGTKIGQTSQSTLAIICYLMADGAGIALLGQ